MIIGNLQFTIAARGLAVLPAVPPALLSKVFRRIVVHNIYLFWFCGCKGNKLKSFCFGFVGAKVIN